jgi:hypothetical protein
VLPRPLPLELLGRHSLSVFCAHIVIALLTLAFFGSTQVVRPWSTDAVLLAGAFAGLFLVAVVSAGLLPYKQRAITLSGAVQSPVATGHSLRR